jgi:transcription antitermination protein NusB
MTDVKARHAARMAVVQALYQMEVSAKGILDVRAEFEAFWIGREVEGVAFESADIEFFGDLLNGVVHDQLILDPAIEAALNKGWPLKRLESVLRAILRAGAYELHIRTDVPMRAVISEYVDIAHAFYGADEPGLVNAVLDTLARSMRGKEFGQQGADHETPQSII